ncbi:serine hydrolase [Bradyrhizobium hipponense]|uniref:Serine hydrolase n=1 Tax=Bradyrhizobium hipponense TaxID=2605638 RepID=A0A5S4YF85_9BRAD|nr:serine hydrolase [Bradyrhizobium hipponense]TYO63056.1 serine hydrolase [Bradyrhizobium hipponense]
MIGRRDFLVGAALGGAAAALTAAASGLFIETAGGAPLSTDDILTALRERVDTTRQSVGIVAATFDANTQRIVPYGESDSKNNRALDGDTVFEIGSITKVFTALLLAEMVTRGEVALDDPVSKYLPDRVRVPESRGKQIALWHLASHTSGLPREPAGFVFRDDIDPYAAFTTDQLYSAVANSYPQYEPGSISTYSNLGFGLLGHVLALRANASYEELIISRICDPLNLADTRASLTPSMQERLAQGHRADLKPAMNWDLPPAIAGAGALRSTANDLVRFMRATCLPDPQGQLSKAAALLLETRRPHIFGNSYYLGWQVRKANGDEIIRHGGATGGYCGHVGFSTKLKSGAIVLSNTAIYMIDDLGFHLANPAFNVADYLPKVTVDQGVLASYGGVYELTPTFSITIRAADGHLFGRGTGQSEFELFAESENRFFLRIVDAQVTFLHNKDELVDRLVWHQNGRDQYCPRIN